MRIPLTLFLVCLSSVGTLSAAQPTYELLLPSDPDRESIFGSSVAFVDGDLWVGYPGENTYGHRAGAFNVYSEVTGSWVQTDTLRPADPHEQDNFGFNILVAGQSFFSKASGSIWVFEQSDSIWSETQ